MKKTYIALGIVALIVVIAVIYNALKNRRTSGSTSKLSQEEEAVIAANAAAGATVPKCRPKGSRFNLHLPECETKPMTDAERLAAQQAAKG